MVARNRSLIGRLLDLDRPIITGKIADFLSSETAAIALASHVSRADCGNEIEARRCDRAARLISENNELSQVLHTHLFAVGMSVTLYMAPIDCD